MITRIDLDELSPTIYRERQWPEGWQEGDTPTSDQTFEGSLLRRLMELEKEGYTCESDRPGRGRALRGEITRCDFFLSGGAWTVKKFPYGWTARTYPITTEKKPAEFDIEETLAWCQENGWTVRRWPGGARAWKGEPLPIRDQRAVLIMRRRAENKLITGQKVPELFHDLAFDF